MCEWNQTQIFVHHCLDKKRVQTHHLYQFARQYRPFQHRALLYTRWRDVATVLICYLKNISKTHLVPNLVRVFLEQNANFSRNELFLRRTWHLKDISTFKNLYQMMPKWPFYCQLLVNLQRDKIVKGRDIAHWSSLLDYSKVFYPDWDWHSVEKIVSRWKFSVLNGANIIS